MNFPFTVFNTLRKSKFGILSFIISIVLSCCGCEKPSVKIENKDSGLSKENKIAQTNYKCIYEFKNDKHLAKDCSSGRIFILDPAGETIEIKKYSDKHLYIDTSSAVYAEFEGFESIGTSGSSSKSDTMIIPTRIILLDKKRKCN
ncbi:MAG: hypothetical protein HGGPFJEG_02098 [Ignavibacteria bacterium]|nr:hypothetical protein [Ignavibacteria bacterium]